VLRYFGKPWDQRGEYVERDLSWEIIAHWMDAKGLLEHGSSVNGSWLTDDGKRVLACVEACSPSPEQAKG
jgi:hypothetical protein